MNDMESALAAALNQTGFPFEHFAFQAAQRKGWTVRANRLYIDPEENRTREMDLLCYKMDKGREVTTCTAILISCKARTNCPWVLLTRPWPSRYTSWDPFPPVPVWTNSDALKFEVEQQSWGRDYFDLAEASGLAAWASDAKRSVFALHEFERAKPPHVEEKRPDHVRKQTPPRFRAKGDTGMYGGVMSLLNALYYELRDLPARRGDSPAKLVYQFNLVQLLDGDLYEAAFEGDGPVVSAISRYRYFARTMLGGRDFSARVEFCTRGELDSLLDELSRVHAFNRTHFDGQVQHFYEHLVTSKARLQTVLPKLERELRTLAFAYGGIDAPPSPGWLRVEPADEALKVVTTLPEDTVEVLKGKKYFMQRLQQAVQDLFRYSGPVEFEWDDDIPF